MNEDGRDAGRIRRDLSKRAHARATTSFARWAKELHPVEWAHHLAEAYKHLDGNGRREPGRPRSYEDEGDA